MVSLPSLYIADNNFEGDGSFPQGLEPAMAIQFTMSWANKQLNIRNWPCSYHDFSSLVV